MYLQAVVTNFWHDLRVWSSGDMTSQFLNKKKKYRTSFPEFGDFRSGNEMCISPRYNKEILLACLLS